MVGLHHSVEAEVFENPLPSKVAQVDLRDVTGEVSSRGRPPRSGDVVEAVVCPLVVAGCVFRLA
jgi:hypothetical protein